MASAVPRPRPRPRPRARVPEATSPTDNGPSPVLPVAPVVVDDDAMFMRNQGRDASTWRKLEKLNKAKQKAARSDSESDSDSPRRKKQKKKMGDAAQAKIDRLKSETLSEDSDSDSDVLLVGDASTPLNKRKKRRSRSRSITPPPPVSKQHLQMAKNIVRCVSTLAAQATARTPSPPPDADESTDTIILDPELQEIAHLAAARAQRSYSEPTDSESAETLEITVKWRPHPLNEAGRATEVVFKLNRTENFRDLFEAVAEDQSILVESLIMSYNGARLVPSVTPASLNLWGDAELVACDKTTWEYLRAHPAASTNPNPPIELSDEDEDALSPGVHSNVQESDTESDAGGETFKLVLQSAVAKPITLTVRPTTTCGAIVQAFLKKAGLADKYASANGNGKGPRKSVGGGSKKGKKGAAALEPVKEPQLVIDGDKMAPHVPIGDMDLDDGDTVDVVGL
ncbi:hypothetical protein B0H19DRAFT_1016304 [Mycena capillaripes]|nr:hypothetical protein B0H19DRAFT_1016304 [Mycena capillaripes]